MAIALVAMMLVAAEAKAQSNQQDSSELATPLEPLRRELPRLSFWPNWMRITSFRKSALVDYTVFRTYQVVDLKGKVHAEEVGRMEYHAPDQKRFVTTSERGSGLVRRMALNPLISSEIEAAAGKEHHDSAISPENYSLDLLGEQQVGPYHCFVAKAIPKRKDKYLFEGKLWIDANDYAVVRIEGHPARKLSFWIQQADFVRQYRKVDDSGSPKKIRPSSRSGFTEKRF